MGATLPHPVTSKSLRRDGDGNYLIGAAEMHGWRTHMEDAMTIRLHLSQKHPNLSMFGVYDGHRGSKCSEYLENYLPDFVGELENPCSKSELGTAMAEFDQKYLTKKDIRLDGSTCVFALAQPLGGPEGTKKGYKVTVCNVGDSRAILIRSNGRVVPLTKDHKPENASERRRIVQAGGYVKHNRVDGQLALSRAFGDWSYKCNPELPYHQQKVIAVPDITNEIMYEGDILLICCDGLFEQLSREAVSARIFKTLKAGEEDPAMAVVSLLDYVLGRGSKDNMSCICVSMQDGRKFAGRTSQFIPGRFHEFKKEQEFVRAYLADAKKSGISHQKLMGMIPPPEEEPEEPANVVRVSKRPPGQLIGFGFVVALMLLAMPEHRALISFFMFFIVVGVITKYPSMV